MHSSLLKCQSEKLSKQAAKVDKLCSDCWRKSRNEQHHLPAFSDVGHATCRTTSNVLSGYSLRTSKACITQGRGLLNIWQQVCVLHQLCRIPLSYLYKGPLTVLLYVSQRCQQQTDAYPDCVHGVALADGDFGSCFEECEVCHSHRTYV